MTEWNAELYRERSSLQEAMAAEVLGSLRVEGCKNVLDAGCGDGRITAAIAQRLQDASVVGVDASANMIELARRQAKPRLWFAVADARALPFRDQFDLVVSFNALHWIPEQEVALHSIRDAMRPGGKAHLRLVPIAARKSIETVLEETRCSPRWSGYFQGARDPYLRLTENEYCTLAEQTGFQVDEVRSESKAWDFGTREKFAAWGAVTMVEWTKRLPESLRPTFIEDVLERYQRVAADSSAEANTFKFYQMTVVLTAIK
jgi:trans-aconitate 2-methyltransferase